MYYVELTYLSVAISAQRQNYIAKQKMRFHKKHSPCHLIDKNVHHKQYLIA